MSALKLMLVFAVAYAQMASAVAVPGKRNTMEAVGVDLKMFMASSSGSFEDFSDQMVNSGSIANQPKIQESTTEKSTEPEMPSTSQQTTTESEVTTVELTPVTLPASCPAQYEAFRVADYSEAEKRFLVRFTNSTMEDCCQKIEQDRLDRWMELSFSMVEDVCTLYTYAPVDRSDIGPSPNNDGNDKILYVKETPSDLCSQEFEGEIFQFANRSTVYVQSSQSNKCFELTCFTVVERGRYQFGEEKCFTVITSQFAEEAAEKYNYGNSVFNIISDADEDSFLAFEHWATIFQESQRRNYRLDIVYDSATSEYRWRQSERLVHPQLWASGHPQGKPCVAIFPDGKLQDRDCSDNDLEWRFLGYQFVNFY